MFMRFSSLLFSRRRKLEVKSYRGAEGARVRKLRLETNLEVKWNHVAAEEAARGCHEVSILAA